MKKLFLFLVIILLPLSAMADDNGKCGENLTWTYNTATRTLTISGVGPMWDFCDSDFYHYYDYYSGNPFNLPWYDYLDQIEKCKIEDGVTSIGNAAFSDCHRLTSIDIPNSLTSIGEYAFEGSSLARVNISDIAAWFDISFQKYYVLKYDDFGDSYSYGVSSNPLYYANLYVNDTLITNLVIPEGVKDIKDYVI